MARAGSFAWFCEKFGVPLAILVALVIWARPHADNFINDNRVLINSAIKTQEKIAPILAKQGGQVDRIQTETERSAQLLRDIHNRILNQNPLAEADPSKHLDDQ